MIQEESTELEKQIETAKESVTQQDESPELAVHTEQEKAEEITNEKPDEHNDNEKQDTDTTEIQHTPNTKDEEALHTIPSKTSLKSSPAKLSDSKSSLIRKEIDRRTGQSESDLAQDSVENERLSEIETVREDVQVTS